MAVLVEESDHEVLLSSPEPLISPTRNGGSDKERTIQFQALPSSSGKSSGKSLKAGFWVSI